MKASAPHILYTGIEEVKTMAISGPIHIPVHGCFIFTILIWRVTCQRSSSHGWSSGEETQTKEEHFIRFSGHLQDFSILIWHYRQKVLAILLLPSSYPIGMLQRDPDVKQALPFIGLPIEDLVLIQTSCKWYRCKEAKARKSMGFGWGVCWHVYTLHYLKLPSPCVSVHVCVLSVHHSQSS